ncbi:MAG: RNA polymerase Rpb4 family protein [Candidatus Methanofastidiosia archaeon]
MIGKKIIDDKYITQSHAKEILRQREEVGELLYEQKTALNTIQKFTKISSEQAEEMMTRLAEEVPRIKVENIIKIIDLMAQDKEDLNVIFSKERIILTEDEITKIVDIVANYR